MIDLESNTTHKTIKP